MRHRYSAMFRMKTCDWVHCTLAIECMRFDRQNFHAVENTISRNTISEHRSTPGERCLRPRMLMPEKVIVLELSVSVLAMAEGGA